MTRQPFPNLLRRPPRTLLGGTGRDDEELLSPPSGRDVGFADRLADHLGGLFQDTISGEMPMGIVQLLEMIQIENENGNGLVVDFSLVDGFPQKLLEVALGD